MATEISEDQQALIRQGMPMLDLQMRLSRALDACTEACQTVAAVILAKEQAERERDALRQELDTLKAGHKRCTCVPVPDPVTGEPLHAYACETVPPPHKSHYGVPDECPVTTIPGVCGAHGAHPHDGMKCLDCPICTGTVHHSADYGAPGTATPGCGEPYCTADHHSADSGAADTNTGILPNAHRCADCSFTTASAERMDGHLRATGHRHEGEHHYADHGAPCLGDFRCRPESPCEAPELAHWWIDRGDRRCGDALGDGTCLVHGRHISACKP